MPGTQLTYPLFPKINLRIITIFSVFQAPNFMPKVASKRGTFQPYPPYVYVTKLKSKHSSSPPPSSDPYALRSGFWLQPPPVVQAITPTRANLRFRGSQPETIFCMFPALPSNLSYLWPIYPSWPTFPLPFGVRSSSAMGFFGRYGCLVFSPL